MNQHQQTLILEPIDDTRLFNLCGELNANIQLIESQLEVVINNRSNIFTIIGEKKHTDHAKNLLNMLYKKTLHNQLIKHADIHLLLNNPTNTQHTLNHNTLAPASLSIPPHKIITAKTTNQTEYVHKIQANTVNFCIGPAGTGKTYLAVACALHALLHEKVNRIILARPAVDAGEKLGFLPGDMAQKVDPYLRPLYDALYDMLRFDHVSKLLSKNIIEVAPLAFMRGRTLSDAFIILDEAQNTSTEQMKMLLTRIGYGSTAVITGDLTQIDLPKYQQSGLSHANKIFQDVKNISFTYLNKVDILRHPIVQSIIDCYENKKQ